MVSNDQELAKDPIYYSSQEGWIFLNENTCVCICLPSTVILGSCLAPVSPALLIWEAMGPVGSTPGWVVVRRHDGLEGKAPCGTKHSPTASQSSSPGELAPHFLLPWSLKSPPFLQDMSFCAELLGMLWAEEPKRRLKSLGVQINPPLWPGSLGSGFPPLFPCPNLFNISYSGHGTVLLQMGNPPEMDSVPADGQAP